MSLLDWSLMQIKSDKQANRQANRHRTFKGIRQTLSCTEKGTSALRHGVAQFFPLQPFKTKPRYFLVLTPAWLSHPSCMWRETSEALLY